MAKNFLVISADLRETRVALIEDGILAELHIERRGQQQKGGTAGDVFLGRVTRVLPGLQAAFIDIGLERAAFLHVEDLIRPDDYDAFLAGGRKAARDEEDKRSARGVLPAAGASADDDEPIMGDRPATALHAIHAHTHVSIPEPAPSLHSLAQAALESDAHIPVALDSAPVLVPAPVAVAFEPEPTVVIETSDVPTPAELAEAKAHDHDFRDQTPAGAESDADTAVSEVAASEGDEGEGAGEADEAEDSDGDDRENDDADDGADDGEDDDDAGSESDSESDDDGDMPGFTVSEDLPGFTVGDDTTMAKAAAPREESGGRRRRWRKRRGGEKGGERGGDRGERGGDRGGRSEARSGGQDGKKGGRGANVPQRLSKATPINEVVKEGQEILVQITKEPISTKGARCSSHITLAGRYVVFLPTLDHFGVSKRIGSEAERARLREVIETVKPPTGGLIVRTVAEGLTKKNLKQDVGYLVRLWGEIAKKREGARAPAILSSELDLVLKTARDLFTDEVEKIVIDDRAQYERLVRFVETFMPDRVKDIEHYQGTEPLFDAYGLEDEIGRSLARKVPLPSGGYLVIDEAEALTAIDVNTGRFVGKGSKDMEETILKTNLEAVHEIAYQLRFRNIGGLIILDLIDMDSSSSREKVRRKLEELLQKDKAKTTLNRISDLGLIEMTRKRTRESLGRILHEPCFYCDGTGNLQSKETVAYEILREIGRRRKDLPGYTVVVNTHPAVADVLTTVDRQALQEAENRFMRKIHVVPRQEYHLEQFDLVGK
jgi:ribonuclease G